MPGTNYYAQSDINPDVWVKFTENSNFADDCELRDTVILPYDVKMFSKGCEIKVKNTGDIFINLADDGLAPIWRKVNADIVDLGTFPVNFNVASYYTLTTTLDSAPFTIGETITTSPYVSYGSKTGTFDPSGENLKVAARITYQNLLGGNFAPGDTITGGITGATAIVVIDEVPGTQLAAYTTNDIQFQAGETFTNGGGVSALFSSYEVTTPTPFWTGVLLPSGDTGTLLALDSELYFYGTGMYVVGVTSGAVVNGIDHIGGKTAKVIAQNGTTLTISTLNPIGPFVPNIQITGGTSSSTARTGTTALLTANDQHFVLQGGNQFIIANIFIANNTQTLSNAGNVYIYTGPNRTGSLLVSFSHAQLTTALNNNTNSYILAGTGGTVTLQSFTLTKTLGKDMYLSIDTPEGSALVANIRFNGYITA